MSDAYNRPGPARRLPGRDHLCGVQVPGEHDLRWIPAANLDASPGGALAERHATA